MMQAHGGFLHSSTLLSLPSEWDDPQFRFGDRVVSRGRTGTVSGLHWVSPDSGQVLIENADPGWWYVLDFAPDQPSYRIMPHEIEHESVIRLAEPRSALSHELLTVV
jgi:hypothetical protein